MSSTTAPAASPLDTMADIVTPYAVRIAATLRVADRIADGHTTPDDLARATGLRVRPLCALLDYLACRGVFTRTQNGSYALNAEAERLRDGHPEGLRFRLDLNEIASHVETAHLSYLAFAREGADAGSAYAAHYGDTLWAALEKDPYLAASWDLFMSRVTHAATDQVVEQVDWSGFRHLVDVGGGSATLSTALLAAHPHLSATVVEVAPASEAARKALAEAGLTAPRAVVEEQSFFDALPTAGDVYLLCQVLHDWDDTQAVRILSRCAEAAGPGGRVRLIERLPHLDATGREATWMDLRMLMLFGGGERTAEQYRELIGRAGMSLHGTATVGSGAIGGDMVLFECTVDAPATTA